MFRSILAVSEGGPDAVMSFRLARRVAGIFEGSVDALHFGSGSEVDARARKSEAAFESVLASLAGSTFSARTNLGPVEALVTMGRLSDVIVLGRPGADPTNAASSAINTAIYESARAVMIAPPQADGGLFRSVILAWNGSFEATRAVEHAMPFLLKASQITILVVGRTPEDVAASYLARNLQRHGLATRIASIDPGMVSARARGRALVAYARDSAADLLVMGAYGGGRLKKFLGLGGATAKVISSCPVPVLMAH